jgi:hypothetical protein
MYIMLSRVQSRQLVSASLHFLSHLYFYFGQAVDEFVLGLGAKETNPDKRRKMAALVLHEEEWTRVRLFCNLLHVSYLIQRC